MELREFAETILYGNNLTGDKLLQPLELTDLNPGNAIVAPIHPARPKELDFSRGHVNQKIEFPNQNNMENERQRGIVLHFFANHELLAMELMALTILRFPEAPKSFRLGVAKTIMEEQRHMQLYMNRMKELRVSFGEIPVNDFFWKCLSSMSSPMDYVTKLSMTFEQANLDFSFFYMNLMKKIGDIETAEILKTVYEEEIGHVKHGVIWFDKWRDSSQSQWQCYVNELKLPLTPMRAKGTLYVREARLKSGFSLDYIDELSVFSASKGRPPDIYYFNPCCELEVARGKNGYSPVKAVKLLQEDCGALCLFLAAKDDIVLVSKKPSLQFLQKLKICGFDLPEWHEYKLNKIDISSFTQNLFGSLCPWGWSPESAEFLKFFIPLTKNKINNINTVSDYKTLYSKVFSAELTHQICQEFIEYSDILPLPDSLPLICNEFLHVLDAVEKFLFFSDVVVLKAPYGTAGQNMKRVNSTSLTENEINWINKILLEHKAIVAEPWFDRVTDFSAQIKINNKDVIYLGQTRFITDKRGQYLGTMLGKTEFVAADILKFLYTSFGSKSLQFSGLLKEISLFVADKLLSLGFVGPFGVDTFIYRDIYSKYGFRIKFISEINPRFTMGRVALEISKRILPGAPALWIHLRVQDILAKFFSINEFINEVTAQFPLEVNTSFKPQIKKGILFTNDVSQANNTVTVLVVGKENIERFSLMLSLGINFL